MVLEVNLPLGKLLEDKLQVHHTNGLVGGGMGAGLLEMTKPKSVTAGIQWRGWWDVIGDGRDEWELEVEVIEDTMVDSGKMLEFELGSFGMELLQTSSFISLGVGALADLKISLALLCMSQRVVDMASNGGLT